MRLFSTMILGLCLVATITTVSAADAEEVRRCRCGKCRCTIENHCGCMDGGECTCTTDSNCSHELKP